MSRSSWKMVVPLINTINVRTVRIYPGLVNKTIKIFNGKTAKQLTINTKHIGYKLGEFALTKLSAKFKNVK